MSFQETRNGIITNVSRVANSATVNETFSSSYLQAPPLAGNTEEVAFSTLCASVNSGTPAAGWTGSGGTPNGSSDQVPYLTLDTGSWSGDGAYLLYTLPVNLKVGLHKIYYNATFFSNAAILDLLVQLNGGSFQSVRSGLDMYIDFGTLTFIPMEDYFYVSENNSSAVLKFLTNGRNVSSGGWALIVAGCLRITRLG